MTQKCVRVLSDLESLLQAASQRVATLIREAVSARDTCHLALSGGSTPAGLYRLLARGETGGPVPWERVHLWFGDERCVPPEDPQSNFRMARETLIEPLGLARSRVHRMEGEDADPRNAAARYASELAAYVPGDGPWPVLDLVLLGVGPDGHVASLFPGSANLAERQAAVSAARVSEEHGWRISLTLPAIERSRHLLVLAAGHSKAEILARVLGEGRSGDDPLPAARVRDLPQAEWYLDAEAAERL